MPRTMHDRLARVLASEGLHVVTLDLLGHGRSDRPEDPREYSMTAFAEQVLALLDHLGAEQAVVGGTSLGANVGLEVADLAPDRVRGLILEMPVLDNAARGRASWPSRRCCSSPGSRRWTISRVTAATRLVPRRFAPHWVGVALDTLDQRPRPMAAAIHGIFFGRIAPSSKARVAHPGAGPGRRPPPRPDPPGCRRTHGRRRDAERPVRRGEQHPGVATPSRAARPPRRSGFVVGVWEEPAARAAGGPATS